MMKFDQKYSYGTFCTFLRDFLPEDYIEKEKDIADLSRCKIITKARELGHSPTLNVYVLEMTHAKETDPRVSIATDAFKVLATFGYDKALVIFKNDESENYRFSYLTISLDLNEKNKVVAKYSNARRYSFYLGTGAKVNTPTKFLIRQGRISSAEDLQNRFSLEVVNKEFYKKISESFVKLVGGTFGTEKNKKTYKSLLQLPSESERSQVNVEFAVRLIGRLIFCWFLREKKGQSGSALMPKELLSLEAISNHRDYYHAVLEPIFFEILNKESKSRLEVYAEGAFSQIPYLNGGLFSPHEADYYKRRGDEQSVFHNTLIIPDEWFINFFEILESYNFTIDENTSFDEELSIDPEMLGRVFENLLAEINPETGESARKSSGSYYTPRVIVDYMVDESILIYLKRSTGIDESKLRALISYDLADDAQYQLNNAEKEQITDALGNLKVLDPACGSGAFPIGALQKIVFVLQQIDKDARLWFKKQIKGASPEIRRVIEREFSHKNFDYIRKLGVIRENIYGVDIQPIATEISRLRCFLTLIVDERVDEALENRGIEPLPNLDFKFVIANSLIALPEEKQTTLFNDKDGIESLRDLRIQFFNATNSERYRLKDEFKEIQKQMLMRMIKMKNADDATHMLSIWDPFSNKVSSWFDPGWMFGLSNFDVVIGNPPYVDSEGMVKSGQSQLRETIQRTYQWTRGNWDLYIAFFEAGFRFLGNNGVLTYITPDKWISKSFGDEFRKGVIAHIFAILKSGRGIFKSANVDSIVTFITKSATQTISIIDYADDKFVEKRIIEKKTLVSPFNLDHLFSENLDFLARIESFPSKVSDFGLCESACATSDAYKIKPLIRELGKEIFDHKEFLKIINTGTIGKYYSKWGKKDMTYLKDKYSQPVVLRGDFLTEFPNSYGKKSITPKIIIKGLNRLDACLDSEGRVIPGKTTLIITGSNPEDLKFLLALINTKLALFYIKEKYPASSYNQGTTFTKDMIGNLPIPNIGKREKQTAIDFVDQILDIVSSDGFSESEGELERVKVLDNRINDFFYKLYDLTPDEIRIVEGS